MLYRTSMGAYMLFRPGGDNAMADGSRDHKVLSSAPRHMAEVEVESTAVRAAISWWLYQRVGEKTTTAKSRGADRACHG